MREYAEQIEVAAATLIARLEGRRPKLAVILGSGLGGFADDLTNGVEVPYSLLPHWPQSTAAGHAGKLVLGRAAGFEVIALSGRVHLYEGYSPREVTFATRVLGRVGVKSLVVTNAAGGINLALNRGGLVLITDHINLQGTNPLIGPNLDGLGPRFPDMSEAYCLRYREVAKECAESLKIPLAEGVYAALSGPSYETPAEIRYLRAIGADVVGMSTAAEVIVANHMGIDVLGISCVTNMAAGVLAQKINHEEVLETGREVRETFVELLNAIIPRLV